MKQYLQVIDSAKSLIDEGERYIIFNDGKAIDTNTGEDVEITVNEAIDFRDYLHKTNSKLENEIEKNSRFKTLISIKKDINLKIIHICDDEKYLNYQIDVAKRLNVNLSVVYSHVVNDAKIKLELLVHHKSIVNYREYQAFKENVDIVTSFYMLRYNQFSYKSFSECESSVNNNVNVYLLQEQIDFDALNVVINDSSKEQTSSTNIYHLANDTKSNLNSYGIANKNSVLRFKNIGNISKGSIHSDLKQKAKGIILDQYSQIEADPVLIIDENDVMAGHGASIGAMNPDDLYYLMSRGLPRTEAEKLMIKAYILPFFNDYEESNLGKFILDNIKID